MHSSRRPAKRLATLLGAILLLFAAAPVAAEATIYKTYGYDTDVGLWILSIQGDETGQPIVLGCSGGDQTVNGQFFFRNSVGRNLHCNEPQYIGVNGEGGDDQISLAAVSAANGYVPARGFNYPRAASPAIVVIGGSGADVLKGGPFGEEFNPGGTNFNDVGADTVKAGGGNDELFGTRFGDKLYGDAGNDVIHPDSGDDRAAGGAGKDALDDVEFGNDNDRFFGGAGPDQLFSGGGNDLLDGGTGADYMDGQGGKDLLLGRDGADALLGSGAADRLFGHAGNDYLRGGPGRDRLVGGPGNNNVRQ